MNSAPIIKPDDWIDQLDEDRRSLALERLRFLDFIREKSKATPLDPCHCPGGNPTLALSMGPPNDPGAKRRIECGICHKFYFWLPKSKNQNRRLSSSTGLASGAVCQCCRKTGVNLVGHHVEEVCAGGTDDPSNIWTVCEPCHSIIHALRRHAALEVHDAANIERET